jgi:hypothetical protein
VTDLDIPTIKRDRYSRPLIDGEPHTRPSTLGKTLDDQGGLNVWGKRMVGFGLADRPDLLAMLQTVDRDDTKAVNELCERAAEAGGATLRRELGTAIHKVLECSWLDASYKPPAQFVTHVAAVNEALRKAGLSVVPGSMERFVVCSQVKAAGSFDLAVTDGTDIFIADLKTGSSVDLGALGFAIQLACYANAETFYDGETHTPMMEVNKSTGVIIHLQPDNAACNLYWLDLEVGWEALQLALDVRTMRKQKPLVKIAPVAAMHAADLATKAEQVVAAGDPWRTWMVERIKQLIAEGHGQLVADMWPIEIPKLSTGEQLTGPQQESVERLISNVERSAMSMFPMEKPEQVAEIERATYVRRPTPDDVGTVDEEQVRTVNLAAKALQPEEFAWLAAIIDACAAANYPIRLGDGGVPSARRHAICTALIMLAPHMDNQVAVGAAWLARNETPHPDVADGDVIGSLTWTEAHRMITIADGLRTGEYHTLYNHDGCDIVRTHTNQESGTK